MQMTIGVCREYPFHYLDVANGSVSERHSRDADETAVTHQRKNLKARYHGPARSDKTSSKYQIPSDPSSLSFCPQPALRSFHCEGEETNDNSRGRS